MFISAPPLVLEFLKIILALFFSNKVFPIKIPNPNPDFAFSKDLIDFIYGSPILFKTSLGNPNPSSSILMLVNSLLLLILTLIILQIILGAFLSGLDGGLIYNTWPDMNGSFFPNDVNIKDYLSYKLLYNPSIIQFYHRTTAYLLLCFIIALNYLFFKKKLNYKYILIFDFAILLQIFLGIITLVSGVEIRYASLHQLGSIFVLSTYLLILYKNTSQQL